MKVQKLTLTEYVDAIDYGCTELINHKNYVLMHGIDIGENTRYLVIEAAPGTKVNFKGDGADVTIYELSLADFHQLCTYYLLDPSSESKALNEALNHLSTVADDPKGGKVYAFRPKVQG